MVLEMGSKNPVVVTYSANINKAIEGTFRSAFGYGGQKCSATSRVYVQNTIWDKFLKALLERVDKLVVGDPREKDVFMGPVINKGVVQKFTAALAEAKIAGGKVLVGGEVLETDKFGEGYYLTPTIVIGLPSTHRLFRDELFMPLIVIDQVKTLEEAIAKINDTQYGLTAGIFSENSEGSANLHEPCAIRRSIRESEWRSNDRSMARRPIIHRLERKRRNGQRRGRNSLSAKFCPRSIPNNCSLTKRKIIGDFRLTWRLNSCFGVERHLLFFFLAVFAIAVVVFLFFFATQFVHCHF